MAKYKRKSKGKTINPIFYVFCEGESEDVYVSFLRGHYKVPIQIITKIARNRICQIYVNKALKELPKDPKDKLYLLYDIDTQGMLAKLKSIKKAIILSSDRNPSKSVYLLIDDLNRVQSSLGTL